jgi:hypothetical protein
MAGGEERTTVARWMKIYPDSSYVSGNGCLQHESGTWSYNTEKAEFLAETQNGIKDPYGAFSVIIDSDKMVWERMEEEEQVSVYLQRAGELPMAPQDRITGVWKLQEVLVNGEEQAGIGDTGDSRYLHFRWDRVYVEEVGGEVRKKGYWHMNAHRPELSMLSPSDTQASQIWKVRFYKDQLILTGQNADSGKKMIYMRVQGISH